MTEAHRPPPEPSEGGQLGSPSVEFRFRGLGHLVGNTPLLAIRYDYRGPSRTLYAKAENLNMTGSIKDRMVLHILRHGYRTGLLAPGAPIAEATSGNTGISLAAVGRALGHDVTIFMPEWMSQERRDLMRNLGAEIRLVGRDEGGFRGSIEMAEDYARRTAGAFLPRQFENTENVAAHFETTGPEIWWQLRFHGLKPDAFVAGVGTGGTVMGVGRFLRQMRSEVAVHPLEPANSPTLSTGHRVGKHRIQARVPHVLRPGGLHPARAPRGGGGSAAAAVLPPPSALGGRPPQIGRPRRARPRRLAVPIRPNRSTAILP